MNIIFRFFLIIIAIVVIYLNLITPEHINSIELEPIPDITFTPIVESEKDTTTKSSVFPNSKIHPYFNKIQIHNNYRDVIIAFHDLEPQNTEPIMTEQDMRRKINNFESSNPNDSEIYDMVISFINEINSGLSNMTTLDRDSNAGWDEPLIENNCSWDSYWTKITGKAPIYKTPVGIQQIKLLRVGERVKYDYSDSQLYKINLFIQKNNVSDQMKLKLTIEHKNNQYTIKNIDVIGYYSKQGLNVDYNYDNLKKFNEKDRVLYNKDLIEYLKQKEFEDIKAREEVIGKMYHEDRKHIQNSLDMHKNDTHFMNRTIFAEC